MFTCNSTKLTSVPIIAYNSNVHFARNDPFSHLRSHMDYCTSPLPPTVKILRDATKYWHAVGQVQDLSGWESRYPTSTKLVKVVLIIPHGNADTERLFSHVGLNKTNTK